MPRRKQRGGLGGASTVNAARLKAQIDCEPTMDRVLSIAKAQKPNRGAQSQLSAARLVFEVSGLTSQVAAEKALEVLIASLRGKVSESAYSELVRAIAGSGVEDVAATAAGVAPAGSNTN